MANETVPPWMLSRIDGAYYGKIPYLCPDIPVSTGLITAKSLSAPRYPGIDGAYYDKIPYLCPDIPLLTGLITAKFSQVQICVYIHLPAMLVRLCCLYLQEI